MRLLLISSIFISLLLGCSSPKTNYYALSSAPIPQPAAGGKKLKVMVGPVSLPAPIDQPQLVIQGKDNQIQVFEYHRWAGSLKSEVGRVIAANIARELELSNVWNFSQSTQTNYDYQIFVDVQTFDSKPGDSVVVDVLWTIKPAASNAKTLAKTASVSTDAGLKPQVLMGRSLVREPVASAEIDALVAAQSLAFTKVSSEIAQSIRNK